MIIRLADRPLQPWKNGLGRTREIAVQPSTAGMDDFLWRVSVAEVDSAAPFSVFPGIDREIVLLDGAGFTMTVDGGRTHALTTPFAPFAFPGEARVDVALVGGPTRDFNLMLRRGRVRGAIDVWRDAGPHLTDATTTLVYCARGAIDSADGMLRAGDAWRPSSAAPTLTVQPGALALVVRVEAVS
ncbi:HutD family protein [Rhodanobacter sp. B2A1Ga4]|uniref:HutD/Ves family protein n=1 Tax=Rhodanobacter TaxID=75309 RepID=UPI000D38337D|nr:MULTISPECIES: HutD family protein [Rhodanobacter]MBQ4855535.1 HutD family protein [Rhodanobacter sp. B2A1Ga4]